MPSKQWLLPAVAVFALSGSALPGVVLAEELAVPPAASDPADRPARGMTMEKVEAKFGAPANRVPAVGEPPISRWEYPGFVVYFEKDRVIHAVATG